MTEPTIVVVFREAEVTALLALLEHAAPAANHLTLAARMDAAVAALRLSGVDVLLGDAPAIGRAHGPSWAIRAFFEVTLPALPDPTGKIRKPAEGGSPSGKRPALPAQEASSRARKGPKTGGIRKGHPCRDCGLVGKHAPDCPRVASRVAKPAPPAQEAPDDTIPRDLNPKTAGQESASGD